MALAFSPRHPNTQKAMNNWERKSQYLLREIVKFQTYIDCLNTAIAKKRVVHKERDEREQMKEERERAKAERALTEITA
jgi:hypothetical protein